MLFADIAELLMCQRGRGRSMLDSQAIARGEHARILCREHAYGCAQLSLTQTSQRCGLCSRGDRATKAALLQVL